uniref:Uncharacterized protein n=1 Tax=Arsenophonus nasoniae TaxID=638 RepID=D2U331_9GAMM|nr:hypothetical protein ARN_30250 [Arsenophonus nasoniae]
MLFIMILTLKNYLLNRESHCLAKKFPHPNKIIPDNHDTSLCWCEKTRHNAFFCIFNK